MSRLTPPSGDRVIIPPRRKLSPKARLQVLLNGNGRCYLCGERINGDPWEAEHPVPFALTGDNELDHLRPAHKADCHSEKTKVDVAQIAKAKRQSKLRLDEPRTVSARPLQGRGFEPARRVQVKART